MQRNGKPGVNHLRNDLLQGFNKREKILGNNLPKNILVQIHIIMHDLVTHADDLPPGDIGLGCLGFGCNPPCGFSKYLYQMGES